MSNAQKFAAAFCMWLFGVGSASIVSSLSGEAAGFAGFFLTVSAVCVAWAFSSDRGW